MMKELFLLRHGEADHLVRDLMGGWSDTHLTERGRLQARRAGQRLAQLLAGQPFQFYCSDLARARETADEVARVLGVEPVLAPEAREWNNGDAANLTREQAKRIELPCIGNRLDWIGFPRAESWRQMNLRIRGFLDRIAGDPHDRTLLVAHGNCGIAVVHAWLGLSEEYWLRVSYAQDPCALTRLGTTPAGERIILQLNDTSHLADPAINVPD